MLDWNATADDVTMSFNMGFVGIREESAAGAGSVVLDMLLKFGLLKYNDDNTWEVVADEYIVDRVKTIKEDLMSASIPVEQADVEESEWVTYMQELRLNYYN